MASDDRFDVKEWAKRYKISEDELVALCEDAGLALDAELTREEFKNLMKAREARTTSDRTEPSSPVSPLQETSKEERVTKERHKEFSLLAAEKGITRPRVAALKVYTGWEDSTKITEAELDAAVDKYLKGKE